jgi:hypothetical protein
MFINIFYALIINVFTCLEEWYHCLAYNIYPSYFDNETLGQEVCISNVSNVSNVSNAAAVDTRATTRDRGRGASIKPTKPTKSNPKG